MLRDSVAMAALGFVQYPLSTFGFADPEEGATLIPFLDIQPPGKMLRWEQLTNWITPNDLVFSVSHYGTPTVDANKWRLEMSGLIRRPMTKGLKSSRAIILGRPHWSSFRLGPTTITERPE